MDFVIPRRGTVMSQETNHTYEEKLENIPSVLKSTAKDYFDKISVDLTTEIANVQRKYTIYKKLYIDDIVATYNRIMSEIKDCFEKGENLRIAITGKYNSSIVEPNIDYWAECNPGKKAAIDCICKQLKEQGWHPIIDLSSYERETGTYWGGREVILECNFN